MDNKTSLLDSYIFRNRATNNAPKQNTLSSGQDIVNDVRPDTIEKFMDWIGKMNKSAINSTNKNCYNGYKIALSDSELDKILNEQSLQYVFNPANEYNNLQEGDKKALKHLVRAAKVFDEIFLKQDHDKNIAMRDALLKAANAGDQHAQKALKLFNIFNGIQGRDGLSTEPVKIFEGLGQLNGNSVYPPDITKEELIKYLKDHIEQAPAILSNDTVVKRANGKLIAVPYNVEFREEYQKIAKELILAAQETTNKDFAEYLRLQSQALVSNDPEYVYKADKTWANIKDCPLEFTIGRESYHDILSGSTVTDKELENIFKKNNISIKSKDYLGARVGIVDLTSSKHLAEYENYLKELCKLMPLKDEYKQSVELGKPDEKTKQTLSDVLLVSLTGDYAACRPGVTLAQNLPNDDKLSVQLNAGKKNVFHQQIRKTEDPARRKILLDSLVDSSQHIWYDREADHLFTIGHELSHSLGPMTTFSGHDKKASLGDTNGDTIEECKADLGSLVATEYFVKIGRYSPETANKIYLTWAVDQLPLSKPDKTEAHRFREIMQLNYYMEQGAIKFAPGGKLSIVPEKMVPVAKKMLENIIQIQLHGNPDEAKQFIEKYGAWNPTLQYASDVQKSLKPRPYKILVTPLADKLLAEAN